MLERRLQRLLKQLPEQALLKVRGMRPSTLALMTGLHRDIQNFIDGELARRKTA